MSLEDRQKWDDRYSRGDHASSQPSQLITALDPWLPHHGRAIDAGGGAGRHAIWLARRGLDVTLADVSPIGLELARQRAETAGVTIETLQIDLQQQPFPSGPWDLILTVHYLNRSLFREFEADLAAGGTLVILQPTRKNLERHARPPAEFLLDDGELPRLVAGLQIVYYEEGWLVEGRHDAVLVARRP